VSRSRDPLGKIVAPSEVLRINVKELWDSISIGRSEALWGPLVVIMLVLCGCDDRDGRECDRLRIHWESRAEHLTCDVGGDEYDCHQHGNDENCDDPRIAECQGHIEGSTTCAELRSIAYCLIDCRDWELDFDD